MQNITSIAALKSAIQTLETEQAAKGEILKDHFLLTVDSFRPVNMIKSALNNLTSSPLLLDSILGAAMGLGTGYLTKKLVVGATGGVVRKVVGSALQFGLTNVIARHTDTIKTLGHLIIKSIFRRKKNE